MTAIVVIMTSTKKSNEINNLVSSCSDDGERIVGVKHEVRVDEGDGRVDPLVHLLRRLGEKRFL